MSMYYLHWIWDLLKIYFQNKNKKGWKLNESVTQIKFNAKVHKTDFIVDAPSHECACAERTSESIVIAKDPPTSTRHHSQELNISLTSSCRILRNDLCMAPYKIQLKLSRKFIRYIFASIDEPTRNCKFVWKKFLSHVRK